LAMVIAAWKDFGTAARHNDSRTQPTGTFSFSQLASFDICPLEYRYKFLDHQRESVQSEPMFLGERLHEALYFLYRHTTIPVTEAELLAWFAARIRETVPALTTQIQLNDLIQRGSELLRFHYANEYQSQTKRTIALEKRFVIELAADLLFVGRVDRIAIAPSGTYEIIEYKTSTRKWTSRPRIPDLLQLAAYGVAALLEYHVPAVLVRRHQLGTGDNDDVVIRETDPKRISKALRRWINRIWRTREFVARPGLHCRSCQFGPICPSAAFPPATTALQLTT